MADLQNIKFLGYGTTNAEQAAFALGFAAAAHRGQTYQQGDRSVPYVLHVRDVASVFATGELFVPAVLHDVLENTPVTPFEIEELFGEEVLTIVLALTRNKSETYFEYIERLGHNRKAVLIKRADIGYNALWAASTPGKEGLLSRYRIADAYLEKLVVEDRRKRGF